MKLTALSLRLAAALALAAPAVRAQTTVSLGGRAGANLATTTVAPAANSAGGYPFSYATDKSALVAWQVGIVAEIRTGNFAVQPGLLFSQKGENLTFSYSFGDLVAASTYEIQSTNRYNWLELPVNFVYTLHGNHGLQLLAGPYAALAVGGRQQGSSVSANPTTRTQPVALDAPVHYGSNTGNRQFDAGLNVGLGYRQGPLQVQLSYGLGLLNLHRDDIFTTALYDPSYYRFRTDAAYNRVAQLTATYFFRL